MLVLTRKPGESLRIGDQIRVVIVASQAGKVRVGIEAPEDVLVLREELINAGGSAPEKPVVGIVPSTPNRVGSSGPGPACAFHRAKP